MMEEKNKKNRIMGIVIFIIVIIIALIISLIIFTRNDNNVKNDFYNQNSIMKKTYNYKDYYIIKDDYEGEYKISERRFNREDNIEEFEVCTVMSYKEYVSYCKRWDISKKYNDSESNYIVFSYAAIGPAYLDVRLGEVDYTNETAKVYVWDDFGGVVADGCGYAIVIPTDKRITKVEMEVLYTELEFSDISDEKISSLSYTKAQNAELVKEYYINSDDNNLNQVINKMLDAMCQQYTISVESKYSDGSGSTEEYDLMSSVRKNIITDDEEAWEIYTIYFDNFYRTYMDMGIDFDIRTVNEPRNKTMITDIFGSCEILISNSDIKYDEYMLNMIENNNNYIITVTIKNKDNKEYDKYNNKEIYYVNKNTMLLEKIEIESDLGNDTQSYSYSDKNIVIPDDVLKEKQTFYTVDKPIIYIYPKEETQVNVKLLKEQNITCSYPKYTSDGWNVIAKPNGDLIELYTNRKLYSLYWEGINTVELKMNEGFVVKGKDSANFLEEKLEILGLNEREAQEFIIYWLPKLENNKYNFIRFQSIDEINNNMPIEITPTPDTIIRVIMEWKGLDKYIEVPEQKLTKFDRKGFTVVEWGGTEVK